MMKYSNSFYVLVHQMGLIIKRQYRLMEAFSMFQDAYSGFVALLGMSHYATAQAAYSLAIINILLGQKSNAYGYFHVASGTFKNVLGKYHILTLAALEWEARCYLAEQRTGESIDLSTSKSEWQNRKNCELCGERFRFFRNHRHHCRVCSRTVCNSCSTHTTLVIEFHNRNTVRMCDKCFDQGF